MTKDKILTAVQKYTIRHGRAPTRLSGDATAYFGEPETWLNIDNALRFGLRGLDEQGSSLFKTLVEHGYREEPPDTSPMTEAEVKEALKAFAQDHAGRIPTQVCPMDEVQPYLNVRGLTWANLDERIRIGRCGFPGGTSLSQMAVEIGVRAERGACPPLKEIREAAKKYLDQNGKLPSLRAGPATPYFGRHETWHRVHGLLKKEHGTTLRETIKDLLPKDFKTTPTKRSKIPLTEATIVAAAKSFQKEHGRLPSYYSGDATPYFNTLGGQLSWRMINRALLNASRGLTNKTSLAQLLVQYGLRSRKSGGKSS